MELAVSFKDIFAARKRIAGVAKQTPLLTSTLADSVCQAEIFFKCENFQWVGAFKFRGAYHAISQLEKQQREQGIVTYSSGNHAQAVHYRRSC